MSTAFKNRKKAIRDKKWDWEKYNNRCDNQNRWRKDNEKTV